MVQEARIQSQVESYQRLKKMVLDATLLNTQHYKIRIKGKVEQSREWSSALPYTYSCMALSTHDLINFYPLTHPILAKTKNQILLFLANICKQPEKYPQRRNFQGNTNILEFKVGDHFVT